MNHHPLHPATQHTRLAGMVLIALAAISASHAQTLLVNLNFNEGTGISAADSAGQSPALNGTLVGGGASWSSDTPSGSGFSFASNGTTGTYVNLGNDSRLNGLGDFTISTWVKFTSTPIALDRLISGRPSSGADSSSWLDVSLSVGASNITPVVDYRRTGDFANYNSSTASTAFTGSIGGVNQWIQLTIVRTGSTLNFYSGTTTAETSLVGSSFQGGFASSLINLANGSLVLGSTLASASDRSPAALFDDLRIYSGALDLNAIEGLRNATVIPEPSAITALAGLGVLGLAATRRRRRA